MSLVLENVTYRYSQGTAYEITALNHVNLSIGDGEFIGIIGPVPGNPPWYSI